MRRFQINDITFDSGFYVAVAVVLLTLPISWSVSWFLAVAFHELCHIITLALLHKEIYSIRIGVSGATIDTEALAPIQELISAAAGPLGGLCLVAFLYVFPQLAVCALLQTVFNLLPIYPMDGSRIIRGLCTIMVGYKRSERICGYVEYITFAFLFLGALLFCFIYKSILMLIFILILIMKSRQNKFPCK